MITENLHKHIEQELNAKIISYNGPIAGGNSKVFKLIFKNRSCALKFYRPQYLSFHNRLETEVDALEFFEKNEIKLTPKLIKKFPEYNCVLMDWVDGTPIASRSNNDIKSLVLFLKRLHFLRKNPDSKKIKMGVDMVCCLEGVIRQINDRLAKLKTSVTNKEKALGNLLDNEFEEVKGKIFSWVKERNVSDTLFYFTLSPVDFGFHNAIRTNGELKFIDFEYFGWSDVTQILSDTMLHPGINFTEVEKHFFYDLAKEIYCDDKNLKDRITALFPLYNLRWCSIMLNPFIWNNSLSTDEEIENLKLSRLKNVRERLFELNEGFKEFPYGN
jgi:hypothetical protein